MKNVVVSGSFSKVPPGQAVGVVDLEHMEAAAAAALPPDRGRDTQREKKGANIAPFIDQRVLIGKSTLYGVRLAPLRC